VLNKDPERAREILQQISASPGQMLSLVMGFKRCLAGCFATETSARRSCFLKKLA
jgi:hypothetical protein